MTMKSLGMIVQSVVSLLILAAGIYGYFLMGEPEVSKRPTNRGGITVVVTEVVASHQEGLKINLDGVVTPFRQIEIAAEVQGRISFKAENCRKGLEVNKGDVLIEIDPRDYELDVRRLEEELEQADAMIRELEVEIQTAENQKELTSQQLAIDSRQLDRNQRLSTTAAASQSELDVAKRAELITRNALQEITDKQNLLRQRLVRMESGKDLVRANLEKSNLALERTKIISPIDGVVVDESAEKDGYVQAGKPVVVIQDNSQLDVACKLHMRQMHWLWQSQEQRPGKSVDSAATGKESDERKRTASEGADSAVSGQLPEASVGGSPATANDVLQDGGVGIEGSPSGPDVSGQTRGYKFPRAEATITFQLGGTAYEWTGVLDRYDGAGMDSKTRMVPCRIHIDDPYKVTYRSLSDPTAKTALGAEQPPTLMTGMFVGVQVDANPPVPLIRVPQKAIHPGDAVWIVKDGELHRHVLKIATSAVDDVIAYQEPMGLQAGDKIVVSPLAIPVDGMKVKEASQL